MATVKEGKFVLDYHWVVKWEQFMGAAQYYIDRMVRTARNDNAPANATHKNDDGTWSTTDDITSKSTRRALGLPPLPRDQVKPIYVAIRFNDGTEQHWRHQNMSDAEERMGRMFGAPTHFVDA